MELFQNLRHAMSILWLQLGATSALHATKKCVGGTCALWHYILAYEYVWLAIWVYITASIHFLSFSTTMPMAYIRSMKWGRKKYAVRKSP